jgi:hypothetical protein
LNPNANAFKKLNFTELQNTWFSSFLHKITEHCTAKDLSARLDSIALVIFNYDRCIEHYLYHALRNHYPSISPAEVAAHLMHLDTITPMVA